MEVPATIGKRYQNNRIDVNVKDDKTPKPIWLKLTRKYVGQPKAQINKWYT